MTLPINSPLLPSLSGRALTVDVALKQPSLIANRIAKLADSQILLPKIFRQYGAKVEGGALLYNSLQSSDYYSATNLEKRAPGTEYQVIEERSRTRRWRSSPTTAANSRCRSKLFYGTTFRYSTRKQFSLPTR